MTWAALIPCTSFHWMLTSNYLCFPLRRVHEVLNWRSVSTTSMTTIRMLCTGMLPSILTVHEGIIKPTIYNIKYLSFHLLINVYSYTRYTCRGLFEQHKLLFSFQMCVKILEHAGKLNMEEYNFFLRGGVVRFLDLA